MENTGKAPAHDGTATTAKDERSLPLRERKRLRTRRTLAETALRLFTAHGFEATTLEQLVEEAEVSKSTFFRAFPAKEAVAVEAEAEVWTAYTATLEERRLDGVILDELRDALTEVAVALDPGWDRRYVATRKLILASPALLAYVDYYRTGVERRVVACLAGKLGLDGDDMRLQVLAELTTTAWSVAARDWVRNNAHGGRDHLAQRLHGAFGAIPASLDLRASGTGEHRPGQ
ncbi:TetR family transcriptional regulator [Actinomadura sp. NAK00032]|uniref:TetR/AcrR family transcriptional regulator n=1 Tax=Actinomadura sp. NAK00032 TaxID=2742128 RepID=UPI001590F61A|nr:TetR/AcrR family transcriptional regulator [Actinomadura sp. NAK00032]QKW35643.1 TetR family transcriptional regulator [Actinomadura sp. NAK00032]